MTTFPNDLDLLQNCWNEFPIRKKRQSLQASRLKLSGRSLIVRVLCTLKRARRKIKEAEGR